MFNYIGDNAEWIFSGIGVAIIGIIVGMVFRRKRKHRVRYVVVPDGSVNVYGDHAQVMVTYLLNPHPQQSPFTIPPEDPHEPAE